ncbi:MAG: glutamate formimidoyltransferase [Opitutaceae bacterium]|nr:glutamate formimidoyltransferase [Opitutaceae bacterium]
MENMKIVECVPNFSEGRDQKVIEEITDQIMGVPGVKLLDVDPGADTNRTVVTFVGSPEGVKEAAYRAIKRASELIDMSKHRGAHPRIGATDVCPFIPVSGVTMDDCVRIAQEVGERVGKELGIPIYLYEHAASRPERRNLAEVRSGEYEGLAGRLKDPNWKPDYGPSSFNAKTGATVVGARDFLIAYNVNLNTKDRNLAHEIALNIRETGRTKKDKRGNAIKVPGKCQALKAVGWYLEQYGQAQVSINLVNYTVTPPHVAFEAVNEEAAKLGLRVTGSQLIGLIPLEPLLAAGRFYLRKQGKSTGVPESELVDVAIQSLGLDQLGEFDPSKKVIEYQFTPQGSLMSLATKRFVDEVSSDSSAPGGGSVAALSGALGAALAAMVANLTVGKKGYEAHFEKMDELARRSQVLKDKLCQSVDEDTRAFNALLEAMRLPKKTPAQSAAREAAIQEGYKKATQIPLETAAMCLAALELALDAAKYGNNNSISDAGVAGLCAWAGAEGALFNSEINIRDIKDESFRKSARMLIFEARQRGKELKDAVLKTVEGSLSGDGDGNRTSG